MQRPSTWLLAALLVVAAGGCEADNPDARPRTTPKPDAAPAGDGARPPVDGAASDGTPVDGATDAEAPDAGPAPRDAAPQDAAPPPDGAVVACADGAREQRECARGGVETRVCDEGDWGPWGNCETDAECEDGAVETQACGLNQRGEMRRTCAEGRWGERSACIDPDECIDGAQERGACDGAGERVRSCAEGRWQAWTPCERPGVCADGDVETIVCGHRDSGHSERHCAGGTWGPWSNCAGACRDECDEAEVRCQGGGRQICGQVDEDPCGEWRPVQPCDFGCADGACVEPPPPVLINEVYYNAAGADAPHVFTELWGPPGTDLAGLRLEGVNGRDGAVYRTVRLQGVIPADGYFVIAHPMARGPLMAQADLLDAGIDFQNGPDSVRLLRGDLQLDAVGYGDFANDVFAGEGRPAPDAPEGQSLTRDAAHTDTDDNAADFSPAPPSPRAE